MKAFVVGIAGGSGSGKSSLAFGLEKTFPSMVRIFHMDDYARPESEVPQRARMLNWDSPRAWQYSKMVQDLAALKAGKSVIINTKSPRLNPDFPKTRQRIPVEFTPRPVIIVEGFLALHYPKIRQLLDLSIYLDAPFYLHASRRVHGKLLGFPPDYDRLVLRPMHDRYVGPSKVHADHVFNVSQLSETQLVEKVAALVVPCIT